MFASQRIIFAVNMLATWNTLHLLTPDFHNTRKLLYPGRAVILDPHCSTFCCRSYTFIRGRHARADKGWYTK